MATQVARPTVFGRLWSAYITALRTRPLRTKMITAGILTASADLIAQLGIERRSIWPSESDPGETRREWEVLRTLRFTLYGSFLFAPAGHNWLNLLNKIQLSNPVSTLAARLTIDFGIWSPFVCAYFPTTMSLMEGKSFEETRQKVEMQWLPTWKRAIMTFGPAQVINLSLVPPHHRLFVLQSVGLCFNVYLSWLNNTNNQILDHEVEPSLVRS